MGMRRQAFGRKCVIVQKLRLLIPTLVSNLLDSSLVILSFFLFPSSQFLTSFPFLFRS
jgi:hypothetical protein